MDRHLFQSRLNKLAGSLLPFSLMAGLHPRLAEFVEQFALIAEEDGLPRIAGRIIALLAIRSQPMSFDELAETLQISRGSVSTNTRLLEQRNIIRRVSRLGERKDLFEIGADSHIRFFETMLRRQQRMRDLAAATREGLPASEATARKALTEMESFFSVVLESTEKTLAKWKKR